jgi:ferredoxin-NADP reductase
LFAPQIHIGSVYSTPELALLIGNIYSYIVSPKKKLLLTLKQKIRLAPTVYNFVFATDTTMKFTPGQYLEWTLQHEKPDNRGNRRYFTIASSPTEKEIIMGVKFYNPASSYKQSMLGMKTGTKILAGQLSGDFTLPKNPQEKSVFIAGGIGITPFRSMVKYLIDTKQKRDIVLMYSNKISEDVVYKDLFDQAAQQIGLKPLYTLTDTNQIPPNWKDQTGTIDAAMIAKEVPDYRDRTFYISGPHGMVTAFEQTLSQMGIKKSRIKTDFFPGFV